MTPEGAAGAQLAARLLVALWVIVGPTLLFLGLMRLLRAMRDDALIARLEHHHGLEFESAIAAGLGRGESADRCPDCGCELPATARACPLCFERLE